MHPALHLLSFNVRYIRSPLSTDMGVKLCSFVEPKIRMIYIIHSCGDVDASELFPPDTVND